MSFNIFQHFCQISLVSHLHNLARFTIWTLSVIVLSEKPLYVFPCANKIATCNRLQCTGSFCACYHSTTCAKYTIYRARPQFVKLSEMLRDGWMGGWMYGWMEMMAAHFYVCSLAAAEYSPEELPATPPWYFPALFSFSDLSWNCVSLEYSFLAGLNDYCHCQRPLPTSQ